MDDDEIINKTVDQKKMAFCGNAEMVEAAIEIIKGTIKHSALVGDTEFGTVVNAITMDVQGQMILDFLNAVDRIRNGSLVTAK